MLKGVLDYSEFKDVDMVIEVGCLKSLMMVKYGTLHLQTAGITIFFLLNGMWSGDSRMRVILIIFTQFFIF